MVSRAQHETTKSNNASPFLRDYSTTPGVGCGGSGVGKTVAAEHAQVLVVGLLAEKEEVGGGVAAWSARAVIEEVASGLQRVGPEGGGHGGVEQHGAHAIIQRAEYALGTTVLLRGVWASEAQTDATHSKEGAEGLVVELAAIVRLKRKYGATKLRLNKGVKGNQSGKHI